MECTATYGAVRYRGRMSGSRHRPRANGLCSVDTKCIHERARARTRKSTERLPPNSANPVATPQPLRTLAVTAALRPVWDRRSASAELSGAAADGWP